MRFHLSRTKDSNLQGEKKIYICQNLPKQQIANKISTFVCFHYGSTDNLLIFKAR